MTIRMHIHDGNDGNCPVCHPMMFDASLSCPDGAPQFVACGWSGIWIAGIAAAEPCNNVATLTGVNNGGGEQHLCTEHMKARAAAGYGYTFVWPCTTNGFTSGRLHPRDLVIPLDALAQCR